MGLTPEQLDEMLGAWALGALDADETEAVELALAGDDAASAAAADLRAVAGQLAEVTAADPPAGAFADIFAAASEVRLPGLPTEPSDRGPATPVEAYRNQMEALSSLLDELTDDDVLRDTEPYEWNVRDLLAHLVAIETYVGAFFGIGGPPVADGTEVDHLRMSDPSVEAYRSADVAQVVADWRAGANAVADAASALSDGALEEYIVFHGVTMRLGSLLVARTFELWTHADDIRRATGRPVDAPPAFVLRAMSDLSVQALPFTVGDVAPEQLDRPAKIVLIGPGGGTWFIGATDRAPEVTFVVDVVDYCRVASGRMDAQEAVIDLTGDAGLAADLLAASQLIAA